MAFIFELAYIFAVRCFAGLVTTHFVEPTDLNRSGIRTIQMIQTTCIIHFDRTFYYINIFIIIVKCSRKYLVKELECCSLSLYIELVLNISD